MCQMKSGRNFYLWLWPMQLDHWHLNMLWDCETFGLVCSGAFWCAWVCAHCKLHFLMFCILLQWILPSTQHIVKYSEIFLKFASVVSANPIHFQRNNPYILEGTEAFTWLVTFLLHYDYIFPEIKEFPLYWNFYQKYLYINKCFITINCNCKDSVSYSLCEFLPQRWPGLVTFWI
jgi:hypothetical protein